MKKGRRVDQEGRTCGIYLHVPFCRSKCPYCDFASGPAGESLRKSHLATLMKEISQSPWKGCRARTLFLGGGTPSELAPDDLIGLVEHLAAFIDLGSSQENTIECNPGTADGGKFRLFRELGFDRLSLGVQSFQDRLLRELGRTHDSAEAISAFQRARAAGFTNINLDLMFAVPGQSLFDWEQDLDTALSLEPEHLSLYNLTIEPGTEFGRRASRGEISETDEETAARMFETAMDQCKARGFEQYEISNFSLPGRECRHNLGYWRNEDFLGFGLGAASCVGGTRWKNTRSYRSYEARILAGRSPAVEIETLPDDKALGEAVMLALRTSSGAGLSHLSRVYRIDSARLYRNTIGRLVSDGLLQSEGDRISLTRNGRLLADYVCSRFLV